MNINQQREAVKAVYSGPTWAHRVAKMSESQIQAIYIKFKNEGKLK